MSSGQPQPRSLDALGRPAIIPKRTSAELQSFLYKTYARDEELIAKRARQYWSPIVSIGVEQAGRAIWDKGVA